MWFVIQICMQTAIELKPSSDLVTIKFKYMPIVIAWEDATRSANRMHI